MQTVRRVLFASIVVPSLMFVGSCKKERAVPPGPPPLPAFSNNAPKNARDVHGGEGMGMGMGHGSAMPADHPPMLRSRGEEAAANAPAPAFEAPDPATTISGTIKLSDKLKDKAPPGSTLFLAARNAAVGGGLMGPPLAAQRYSVGAWPLKFELSQANVMLEGSKLEGKVVITARVDQDGDAMTKQVGDIEGVSGPISVPSQGVNMVLDTVRSVEAGAPSPANMGGGMGGGGAMPPGHPALPAGHPHP